MFEQEDLPGLPSMVRSYPSFFRLEVREDESLSVGRSPRMSHMLCKAGFFSRRYLPSLIGLIFS
jgi:hypothetical protein